MNLKVLLGALLSIVQLLVSAQSQTDTWYFGYKAGMRFYGDTPLVLTDGSMISFEGCSSISDGNGNLLFYTNGQNVWNKYHQQMPNGFDLKGHESSTQSSLIIPKPGSLSVYYIFTTNALEKAVSNELNYSEVDLTREKGLGDVTVKNISLHAPVTEKLTATFHENNKDIWVVTHEWETNSFYAYQITETGIQSPIISNAGSVHKGGVVDPNNNGNSLGAIKFSPDGTKLGVVVSYDGIVEIFDFDNATGRITNPSSISVSLPYGLAFSPDGSKLYVSTLKAYLYQFSLTGCPPNTTAGGGIRIGSTSDAFLGTLQLGTNGKIYVARNQSKYLGVIHEPNETGTACNFVADGLYLEGKTSGLGLPNFIQSYFDQPPFSYQSNCLGENTNFSVRKTARIDSVLWEFGKKNQGVFATSKAFQTSYRFSSEGMYQVTLTIYYTNGSAKTFCRKIVVAPDFDFSLGPDTILCGSSPLVLNISGMGDSFRWQNGSNEPIQEIRTSGTYWVDVRKEGCIKRDSINILFDQCPVFIPNVITPNQDDANETFYIKDLQENWRLVIINRWGKVVFETKNYLNNWAAEGLENGVYYYYLLDPRSNRTFKGWLQVLR